MRRLINGASLLAIVVLLCGQPSAAAVLDDSKFEGQWKLVLLTSSSDYEFFILNAEQKDGKLSATIGDAAGLLADPTLSGIEDKNGTITLTFKSSGPDNTFKAR